MRSLAETQKGALSIYSIYIYIYIYTVCRMGNRLNQGFSNCGSVVNVLLLNVIFGVEKQMD